MLKDTSLSCSVLQNGTLLQSGTTEGTSQSLLLLLAKVHDGSSQSSIWICCSFTFVQGLSSFFFFFFFHYKLQIIICQNVFWVMPFVWPRLCPQLCLLGVCGTVCVLVTQGSGPGLTPPSAPVKVVPRTQLLIKMPGAGTPLTLALHVKSDKTQCLSVLFCKLFFFF